MNVIKLFKARRGFILLQKIEAPESDVSVTQHPKKKNFVEKL
jgi:hypothetical protein